MVGGEADGREETAMDIMLTALLQKRKTQTASAEKNYGTDGLETWYMPRVSAVTFPFCDGNDSLTP